MEFDFAAGVFGRLSLSPFFFGSVDWVGLEGAVCRFLGGTEPFFGDFCRALGWAAFFFTGWWDSDFLGAPDFFCAVGFWEVLGFPEGLRAAKREIFPLFGAFDLALGIPRW